MPILTVEIAADHGLRAGLARDLADRAGDIFETGPGQTWVRIRVLAAEMCAENGTEDPPQPVFVTVVMWKLPTVEERAQNATDLASAFAAAIGCSADDIHIIFEPDGNERVAFGGKLVTD